jgi:CRISPR-associated protein Cas1
VISEATNVLYVTAERARCSVDAETIVVKVKDAVRLRVPIHHLEGVVMFGTTYMTPDCKGTLAEAGVTVSYLSFSGRFLARVEGIPGGSVALRRAQHRAADSPERSLALSRAFVVGKLASERAFLRRQAREADDADAHASAIAEQADLLSALVRSAASVESLDTLRGIEGAGARAYFSVFGGFVRGGPEFSFSGRSRRPPRDRINALLSFGYALLMRDCATAAASVGLDPAVGYLHEDRPGRLGLALDLMEELRVPVVDRLVVSLINRAQLKAADILETPTGGFELTNAGRKTFLSAYQQAKDVELQHGFLEQNTTWRLVPHLQARLLARVLRADLDEYRLSTCDDVYPCLLRCRHYDARRRASASRDCQPLRGSWRPRAVLGVRVSS